MDSRRKSDVSEAKDFLKEKWAILESERIRKKRKRKAVITVFGIIGQSLNFQGKTGNQPNIKDVRIFNISHL